MRRLILSILLAASAAPALAQTAAPPATPPAATPPSAATPDVPSPGGKMFVKLKQKMAAANTTHDGHLTLAQAKAAKLKAVTQNFAAIDTANRGYVTYDEVAAYLMDQKANQLHAQAQQLRAADQ